MKRHVKTQLCAAKSLPLIALPLLGHHSFAGTCLEDAKPQEIQGTLKSFQVRNPHSFVTSTMSPSRTKKATRCAGSWNGGATLRITDCACVPLGGPPMAGRACGQSNFQLN